MFTKSTSEVLVRLRFFPFRDASNAFPHISLSYLEIAGMELHLKRIAGIPAIPAIQ